MNNFLGSYVREQKAALDSIPVTQVAEIVEKFKVAWNLDRQIFVFGNGGSAANASHFVTDLGKGASDKLSKPFRCMSLNDNTPWMTALGNDYNYDQVFTRQMLTFARPGDIAFTMSVSGSSPNLISAVEWAKQNGVYTIALVGAKRGKLADIADFVIVADSTHYGRVEDVHMGICHMICYAFIEGEVKV
jgi:D-sedoheptulose 7-phosphate isomerase